MKEVEMYKGSELSPPQSPEPRIIRPNKNYLWKNHCIFGVSFIGVTIAIGVLAVIVIAILSFFSIQVDEGILSWLRVLYLLIWLVATIIYFPAIKAYYRSMEYVVHGHTIIIRKGIFFKQEKHVPYQNVTNLSVETSSLDRLLNIGTVVIQTASMKKAAFDETPGERLEGIKVYLELRDYILTQVRRFQISEGHISQLAGSPRDEDTLSQILGELKNVHELLAQLLTEITKKRQ